MPDITTIALCSTSAAGLMCIAMIVSWFKDGRPRHSFWLFAPFAIALPAGILLSYAEYMIENLALAFGWFLLTLAYAAAWQTARFAARRKPLFAPALIACLVSLVFSLTLGSQSPYAEWNMLPRNLLMAGFCLLAAQEFHQLRDRHLPSAQTLAWIFLGFGLFHVLRSPFSLVLPAPLGSGPTQLWSIATFNVQIVLQGLLLGVFMTTLGRERIAMHHFRLAMVDPLTGVGNRRALDRRLAEILEGQERPREGILALAALDIDHFKAVNDRFGHSFGDVVIAGAANIACEFVNHRNVFRLGGEEFAVLIEAPDSADAYHQAEMIRGAFAARAHISQDISHRATLSSGVAVLSPEISSLELLAEADRALYLAKALGRNRTILADEATMAHLIDEALHDMVPRNQNETSPKEASAKDESRSALKRA